MTSRLYIVVLLSSAMMMLLLPTTASAANNNKKLILFAGPHKAASGSVEMFFHNHASGYIGTTFAEGLQGWLWPQVPQDMFVGNIPMEKQEIFNALVTLADNTTAQLILKQAIQDAWNMAEYGIIIGTAEFDRVGKTPYTHRDGLRAMRGILQQLSVHPQDVTVVLNYRTPRRDQWISMWKHVEGDQHYRSFICKGNTNELLELVDTAMNPFQLALAYRREHWNVVLIDMSGVNAENKDVAHVIACDVLHNTTCEDGFVVPVLQTYNENYGGDKNLGSLHDTEQQQLDQLFLERDCYYQPLLEDDEGFQILYRNVIWEGCVKPFFYEDQDVDQKSQQEIYQHLSDPAVLLDALRAQKDCAKDKTKMKDVLVGDYNAMTGKKPTNEEEGAELVSEETTSGTPTQGLVASKEPILKRESDRNSSPWVTTMFVLLAVGLGMYQLHLIQRNGRGRLEREQELSLVYRPNDLQLSTGESYSDKANRESYSDGEVI